MQYDMIVRHARVFDSFRKCFVSKDVAIQNGVFAHIADHIDAVAAKELDASDTWMIPGLVDIHMHIESSMSIPSRFSDCVMQYGVTSVVADPHEMANVFGMEGILTYLSNEETSLDIFYGIPSSVPSTNEHLETTGGRINAQDVAQLLRYPRVVCLGEVMNFHDVCYEPDSISAQIIKTCKKERFDLPLEGHCPKISGEQLDAFLAAGISADHTQQSKASVLEKVSKGMFLEIQRKSMTPEVMQTLIDHELYEYFAFVSDDVMADALCQGHLNRLVQLAIQMGMKPEWAIYCSTFTSARRMHLEDRGAIVPGRIADFILLSDLQQFTIQSVYKRGIHVQDLPKAKEMKFPAHFYHSLHCEKANAQDFTIAAQGEQALCNIMEIEAHSTFTKHIQEWVDVRQGNLHWQQNYTLACVMERYGKRGTKAFGFVKGAFHSRGAIATSWAHDHHNILILGTHEEDMALAQQTLLEMQGGYVVVRNGTVTARVYLEIGGIVSGAEISVLGAQLAQAKAEIEELGYVHDNVIMSISTLSLPVSPQLKLTDRGLIMTKEQRLIPLVEEWR